MVALATLTAGNFVIPAEKAVVRDMLGHDFMAFYTAGQFVRTGRTGDLYKLPTVREYQHELARGEGLDLKGSFGPWWNPPFYAWPFVPLSSLPYSTAQYVWGAINLAFLGGAIMLLCRMLIGRPRLHGLSPEEQYEQRLCREDAPPATWKTWALVPLLVLVSSPCMQALSHGQNTFGSLLILALTVTLWRGRRAMLAGVVAGLLFYKPQLGAVVAMALVLDQGWRAAAGLAITGSALLAINVHTLPGTLGDYLHLLPANVHFMQVENAYLWERHLTWKAFWRLLAQGRDVGEAVLVVKMLGTWSVGAYGLGLLAMAWMGRKLAPALRTDRRIAAAICAMPLLMPFYFDYDGLLLAIPAVLVAAELRTALGRMGKSALLPRLETWLLVAWSGLFVWMYVNPGLGRITRFSLSVPLAGVVSGLLIARMARPALDTAVSTQPARAVKRVTWTRAA